MILLERGTRENGRCVPVRAYDNKNDTDCGVTAAVKVTCLWVGWSGPVLETRGLTIPRRNRKRRPAALFLLDRLVGQLVKASASRAEGPGFESRLRRDFFGVESYQ